jgi:RNA polymerase sigma-70 factor (ECF subfamily)
MSRSAQDDFLQAALPSLDLVYNLARRLVRDPGQLEDLVQETYLKAFRAWVEGRRPRKIEPWIATICLNTGRSWLRRASATREIVTEEPGLERAPEDVERDALKVVEREALRDALWRLPEEQRIAVALMDLVGFSAAETARILGSPRGTVLSRVHRGHKRLAALLSEEVRERDP